MKISARRVYPSRRHIYTMTSSSFSKLLARLSVRTGDEAPRSPGSEHCASATSSPRSSLHLVLPRRFRSTSTGSPTSPPVASTVMLEAILSDPFKRRELVDELVMDQDLDAVTQVKFVAHVLQYERELDLAVKRDLHAAISEKFLSGGEAFSVLWVTAVTSTTTTTSASTKGNGQETDISKLKQSVVRHLLTRPRVKHTLLQELLEDL